MDAGNISRNHEGLRLSVVTFGSYMIIGQFEPWPFTQCPILIMSKAGKKLFTLFTNHLTPNGLKVSIYLEELKLVDPAIHYK